MKRRLRAKNRVWSGALPRQQFSHDVFHAFAVGQINMQRVCASEEMNDVTSLRVVPPAQILHLNADAFQSLPGSLNLDLESPVS
jgi:hypothetical protein